MLASVKGSPGVTTACLALAAMWPQPALLAELDPDGGDVRYRLRSADGGPLTCEPGLLSYAAEILDGPDVRHHVQQLAGGLEVLVGLPGADAARHLLRRWSWVGALLDSHAGGDVIADCGRLSPLSPTSEIFPYATGLVLVTRPTVDAVGHLRSRLETAEGLPPVYVVVVAGSGDARSARQVEAVLADAQLPATVVGTLAYDPVGAGTLAGEWAAELSRTALMRSARDIAARLDRDLVRDVDEDVQDQDAG